mmetsp:Transcript_10355/g.28226  ORF Transcript_10355/g.28226 Transcript_10355/m.28226 type:complete len:235 (+) Transcript_10355:160-864(+)
MMALFELHLAVVGTGELLSSGFRISDSSKSAAVKARSPQYPFESLSLPTVSPCSLNSLVIFDATVLICKSFPFFRSPLVWPVVPMNLILSPYGPATASSFNAHAQYSSSRTSSESRSSRITCSSAPCATAFSTAMSKSKSLTCTPMAWTARMPRSASFVRFFDFFASSSIFFSYDSTSGTNLSKEARSIVASGKQPSTSSNTAVARSLSSVSPCSPSRICLATLLSTTSGMCFK